ncbi:MAG TPA: hypothetical protein VG708_14615 [Mycobacteriales bacterium]|nr:hypothetical protein [Mycobacteriales bacterium]
MSADLCNLTTLLAVQSGMVTRSQLRVEGVTWSAVRANLRARRWQVLNDQVICAHNGSLRPEQARWAVWLSAPFPSALCSLTAMELRGVRGFETAAVHILVQRGARVLPVPGVAVVVHESRRFTAEHVCHRSSPPSTTLERAVVDAAVWSDDYQAAARIVVAPVQQRLTSAARLADELALAGRVRYRRLLRAFLADIDGGAQALSEVAFLRWCRRHGFPRPHLQVRVDGQGRRRYLDAAFVGRDDRRVLVEVDGGIHLTLRARWQDTAKDNDAALDGELTLRFPSVAIYSDDARAVTQLRRALRVVSVRPRHGAA